MLSSIVVARASCAKHDAFLKHKFDFPHWGGQRDADNDYEQVSVGLIKINARFNALSSKGISLQWYRSKERLAGRGQVVTQNGALLVRKRTGALER